MTGREAGGRVSAMQLSLSKLPWYGQAGVAALLCAAAIGVFYQFHETPAQAAISTKRQELTGLQAEVRKGRQAQANLPAFEAEVNELEGRLNNLRAVLPEQKDVADLLRRLQTLAAQSNLEIRAFTPQAIAQQQMHAEWPIKLEIDGTYHDLGLFFDKVSKVPRIINVSNIKIAARSGRRDETSAATVTASCVATTFVLSEAPAEEPQAAGRSRRPAAKPGAKPGARPAAKPAR